MNHLLLNSLPLGLQELPRQLQLGHQPVDFYNRSGSDFLDEGRNLRVSFCLSGSFCLHQKFCVSEIANFPFSHQICGYSLEVRHLKFHSIPSPFPPKSHFLAGKLIWC